MMLKSLPLERIELKYTVGRQRVDHVQQRSGLRVRRLDPDRRCHEQHQ